MRHTQLHAEYRAMVADLLADCTVRSMSQYIQHGRTTTYRHSLMVSFLSYKLCRFLRFRRNLRSVARAALLHDFFLYDWHIPSSHSGLHGYRHPRTALENARRHFPLNELEENIIYSHMWPLTLRQLPLSREAVVVCLVDKYCSLLETLRR